MLRIEIAITIGCLFFALGFFMGIRLGAAIQQSNAIRVGVAQYNPTNAQFEFKVNKE